MKHAKYYQAVKCYLLQLRHAKSVVCVTDRMEINTDIFATFTAFDKNGKPIGDRVSWETIFLHCTEQDHRESTHVKFLCRCAGQFDLAVHRAQRDEEADELCQGEVQ